MCTCLDAPITGGAGIIEDRRVCDTVQHVLVKDARVAFFANFRHVGGDADEITPGETDHEVPFTKPLEILDHAVFGLERREWRKSVGAGK